jgi:hypothetical protein
MDLPTVLLHTVLLGLVSPLVFIPAILLGWFARSWIWVFAGAVLIALAGFGYALTTLPPGAFMVWAAAPLKILPPLAWAAAVFTLRRWIRQRTAAEPGNTGVRVVWLLIGLVLGAIAGGILGIALGTLYVEVTNASNFEGAAGYFVMLFCMPLGVLFGVIIGAVLGWRLSGRRAAPTAAVTPGT